MHNYDEKYVLTAGLVCLCPLVAASAAVPAIGYALLGLIGLGLVGLLVAGLLLWWDTSFRPEDLPRRASDEAAARARRARREIQREVA